VEEEEEHESVEVWVPATAATNAATIWAAFCTSGLRATFLSAKKAAAADEGEDKDEEPCRPGHSSECPSNPHERSSHAELQ
jgi:hypothetical protein